MQHRAHLDKEEGFVALAPPNQTTSCKGGNYSKVPAIKGGLGQKEKHLVKVCLYYVVPLLLLALLTGVLYLNLQVKTKETNPIKMIL